MFEEVGAAVGSLAAVRRLALLGVAVEAARRGKLYIDCKRQLLKAHGMCQVQIVAYDTHK